MMTRTSISKEDRARAVDIGNIAIKAFYGSRAADLENDSEFLKGHFERLLRRAGYGSLIVQTRPKAQQSALDKLRRKCEDEKSSYAERILKGEAPQAIFTDLIGVRITCKFSDQIDEIEELIRESHLLRTSERADHRKPTDYANFGYAALHLIGEPIEATPSKIYFSGCPFELQIRSALMDIWSVVNWDIAYTGERELPYELLRRMSTLSALFYLVDQEFIRIRNDIVQRADAKPLAQNDPTLFQFSTTLAVALEKRGISFDAVARKELAEHAASTRVYFSNDGNLKNRTTEDALALYLCDKVKFAWVVSEDVRRIVHDIDRRAVSQ